MLVSEAISLLKERINDNFDTGFKDETLISYINDAITYLSSALISRNDPLLVREVYVDYKGIDTPKNFVRFAGSYPIRVTGNKMLLLTPRIGLYARYFYMPDMVEEETDELPFKDNDTYDMLIIRLACIYALNQHEYNVQQDEALRNEIDGLISTALGAVE